MRDYKRDSIARSPYSTHSPTRGERCNGNGEDMRTPPPPDEIQEACLPWSPIPERFNHEWAVGVVHLAEGYDENTRMLENLSVGVAASSEPTASAPREFGAWRIDFRRCEAYRKRIVRYQGAEPFHCTTPDAYAAFWEIAPSRYLVESGVFGAANMGQEIHHYVIVSGINEVYEIIAEAWRCTPLSQEWAQPFSGGPFPRW
jgi:hypothetical protein